MSEGEFKKRILGYHKTLCIHVPEEDTEGNITQKVHDAYRRLDFKEIEQVIDEAKKDFNNIYKEIEKNATEDTLFERMVLVRLRRFCTTWFGEKR